jgi:hypothetical protein
MAPSSVATKTRQALSAAYFLIFSPCSYYCWFHQLYHALRVVRMAYAPLFL